MYSYKKFMDSLVDVDKWLHSQIPEIENQFSDNTLEKFYNDIKTSVASYKKTGKITGLSTQLKSLEAFNKEYDDKENAVQREAEKSDPARPRRRAFREASQVMDNQLDQSNNSKTRKPNKLTMSAFVKVERLSKDGKKLESSSRDDTVEDPPTSSRRNTRGGKMLQSSSSVEDSPRSKQNTKSGRALKNSSREDCDEDTQLTKSKRNTSTVDTKGGKKISRDYTVEVSPPTSRRNTRGGKILKSSSQNDEDPPTRSKRTTSRKITKGGKTFSPSQDCILEDSQSTDTKRSTSQRSTNAKRLRSPSQDAAKKTNKSKRTKHKESIEDYASDKEVYEDTINTEPIELTQTKVSKKTLSLESEVLKDGDKPFEINSTLLVQGNKHTNRTLTNQDSNNTAGPSLNEATVDKINATMVVASKVNETMVIRPNKAIDTNQQVNETLVLTKNVNETLVLTKKVDETILIEKNKSVQQNLDDSMTADESIPESRAKKSKLLNHLDESDAKTPVNQVLRVTRTRKRKLTPEDCHTPIKSAGVAKTPLAVKTQIGSASINRRIQSADVGALTLSAMKASMQDYRMREQMRKQQETEAAKKKKAEIDEKRRKREEKELKVKLQREALEKLKLVEQQKAKEEKLKMIQLSKQEKLQKLREENQKKQLLAKKMHDEKRLEEAKRRAEEDTKKSEAMSSKAVGKKDLPIYMTQKAPPLPTYDCYDSDELQSDERSSEPPKEIPIWVKREYMHVQLKVMQQVEDKFKNTLFCPRPETPNLQDIFQNIDPRILKRNSSAIWHTIPRCTMLPTPDDDV